ncbi:glycosyl transferase family 2 [Pseudalgibacter alginicilyticus]|uniref:Glycosyl transferase family 2 n=1 Tax=Pseudalgibacter alginicilyticus TaxID=1736674 RepID=A0A0P0CV15_9FLAO|nr:glycosyl transferase family 2 [Pseudalgibacter alginicilyticus]
MNKTPYRLSIIIPTLNEANNIFNLLNNLTKNSSNKNISEIIVVDGGSTDKTKKIVSNYNNIILLTSEKGRAKQMNLGAKAATGNILYFLHADSFPPQKFDELIINEVQKGNEAGCFRMQFDSSHWWLLLAGWLTKFNWRACRGGDQSQFITKTLFNIIGGFNERYIIYEDNILINELYARNQFVVINKKLKTSARLYNKHGIWKIQYHFLIIHVKKWLGASADDIYLYYKKNIY